MFHVRVSRKNSTAASWVVLPQEKQDTPAELAALPRGDLTVAAAFPPEYDYLTALGDTVTLAELNLLAYVTERMPEALQRTFLQYTKQGPPDVFFIMNTAFHMASGEQPVLPGVASLDHLELRYRQACRDGELSPLSLPLSGESLGRALQKEGVLLENGAFVFQSHADAPYKTDADLSPLLRWERGQYDAEPTIKFLYAPVSAMEVEESPRLAWDILYRNMLDGINKQLEQRNLRDLMTRFPGHTDGYDYLLHKVPEARITIIETDDDPFLCAIRMTVAEPLTEKEEAVLQDYFVNALTKGPWSEERLEPLDLILGGHHYTGDRQFKLRFYTDDDRFFLADKETVEELLYTTITFPEELDVSPGMNGQT